MKKILAGIMASAFVFGSGIAPTFAEVAESITLSASAAEITDSGKCGDNVTWTLDSEGTLTLSGEGEIDDYPIDIGSPFYGMPVEKIVIEEGITRIGCSAFADSTAKEICLPGSITEIGILAFASCPNITSIVIPENVEIINYAAFANCENLEDIVIPESLTTFHEMFIARKSFEGTKWWDNQPDGIIYINNIAYACKGKLPDGDAIIIEDGTVGIADYAFGDWGFKVNNSPTSVIIPDSVVSIGMGAFDDTPWLEAKREENPLVIVNDILIDGQTCEGDVVIPDDVTSIGDGAFYSCRSLTGVSIPESVTSIGNSAFSQCENLTEITIPESVTSIGDYAFGSCYNLTSVTIPESVTSIGNEAFRGCSSLTGITIPDGVTSIGRYAFGYCNNLTSVTILNPDCEIYDSYSTISNGWVEESEEDYFSGTIHGYDGSTAQAYAEKYGYKFESLGEKPSASETVSGKCGENLTWTLDAEGTLTLSGTGEMDDYGSSSAPWSEYKKDIISAVIQDGVTSIGNYAFDCCDSLTSVTIPESVTDIGESAFQMCISLNSATIPDGVTSLGDGAFYGCYELESITLPDSLTSIGKYAFSTCSKLADITIPESVTSIGGGAFNRCPSLTSIVIPDGVASIADGTFYQCGSLESVTIPDSVTSIEEDAFFYCSSLTEIILPDGMTSIGDEAFWGCVSLTGIIIPDSVTYIGETAFSECRSLTDITIPESVASIGNYAFSQCENLTDITILNPDCEIYDSYSTISNGWDEESEEDYFSGTIHGYDGSTAQAYAEKYGYKFESLGEKPSASETVSGKCGENLTWTLDVEGTLTISGTGDMDYWDYMNGYLAPWLYENSSKIKKAVIEDGVTNISANAFYYCSDLTEVIIPESVTSIEYETFANCENLTDITIPDSVTNIGRDAFKETPWLESKREENPLVIVSNILIDGTVCEGDVIIPDGVTSIGDCAFRGCSSLTGITIPDSVTSIGDWAFRGCSSLTGITIPDSVTSLGCGAFYGCSSLTDITLPEGITYIDSDAFYDTPWLESKREENPLVIVNSILIDGKTCEGDVVIPDGVTKICANAFSWSRNLTGITIPDSVTSIGNSAFSQCENLTEITIPDSVTYIGVDAFYCCENLTDITILNPDCEIDPADDFVTIPLNVIIHGYEGSTAQAYAEKYEMKFESLGEAPATAVKGDVDGDGKAALSDATMTLKIYASKAAGKSLDEFTAAQIKAADVNGDGSINIADATAILKIYAENAVGK